ncbi:putative membrane protein [Halanaerobium saccharolyticum]|uniref:Putative membrane protein n=2 Tax=Halanaerobium TaxID=2330 RepID=A0A4R8G6F3_9FIRM|nr:hypothetical protein [Halanaerobium]TDW00930.1 putative membrane protein [Halanaerobium saccharolyticum]TDX39333.1 putative membrane protein [Halanaerobium congolense]TDX52570.1 putative membrane protein [Halanaerobium saccharolyticum]
MINFAHGNGWGSNGFGHMDGFGHMNGFGGGIFGWIMILLFAALVITGIVYLIKNMKNDSDNSRKNNNYRQIKNNYQKEDSAVNIARERYAKGEISKEELDKILNDLK